MVSMNENDKNRLLKEMLRKGETYQAAVWGTISADKHTYAVFSSLPAGQVAADIYAYIGMSEEDMNFVLVSTLNPDHVLGTMRIPFSRISAASIKSSPLRKTLDLIVADRLVRIRLMNNTFGTDLKNQKEGIRKITERFRTTFH